MLCVLVIITTGFSQYGGLTSVMMNYLRYMDRTDLKIDILSGNDPQKELLTECKMLGINYVRLAGRTKNPVKYVISLKRILNNYDVVHINANSATAALELIAAKAAGVQNRIVHNHTAQCEHVVAHKILRIIYIKLHTEAIACSAKAGNWIFGKGNFLILNNSIDTQKYRYSKDKRSLIRKAYKISEEAFVIGHVGKIYKPKNHRRILEIFIKVIESEKDAILLLVGDGEMRNEIEEYAVQLGLDQNTIFAGLQKNIYDYLSAFDCFLFPSLWEGMPLALLEAQASGLNCVISDVIDKEAAICESVTINSLNDNNEKWARDILKALFYDRETTCEKNIAEICKKNYDVASNANMLRELYMKQF